MLKKNVGTIDRSIRIILGLGLIGIYFAKGEMWGLVGIIPLATGLMGTCPAYLPLGLNTCSMKKE
jgi:hypothetical protein